MICEVRSPATREVRSPMICEVRSPATMEARSTMMGDGGGAVKQQGMD